MINKTDVLIRKEGIYYTVYLGDISIGCGAIDDMIEVIEDVTTKLEKRVALEEIIDYYTVFY